MTVLHQTPLSMGFSRQECWSELPFPSPGDLPNAGIKPGSPAFQVDSLPSEPPGKLNETSYISSIHHFSLLLPQQEEIWQARHEYLFLTKTKAKDYLLLIQTNSKIFSIKIIALKSTFGVGEMTLGKN